MLRSRQKSLVMLLLGLGIPATSRFPCLLTLKWHSYAIGKLGLVSNIGAYLSVILRSIFAGFRRSRPGSVQESSTSMFQSSRSNAKSSSAPLQATKSPQSSIGKECAPCSGILFDYKGSAQWTVGERRLGVDSCIAYSDPSYTCAFSERTVSETIHDYSNTLPGSNYPANLGAVKKTAGVVVE
jgi:hypothetical protein